MLFGQDTLSFIHPPSVSITKLGLKFNSSNSYDTRQGNADVDHCICIPRQGENSQLKTMKNGKKSGSISRKQSKLNLNAALVYRRKKIKAQP